MDKPHYQFTFGLKCGEILTGADISGIHMEGESDMRYNFVADMPEWARPTVESLMKKKQIASKDGELNFSEDMLRVLVIVNRR